MTVRLLVGDVRERIREIPDDSVDVVMCSPPFLALRKYGDNAAEMGSERTPADFLDALLELTGEFRRVLTPHGSIAIELGDTYASDQGRGTEWVAGGSRFTDEGLKAEGRDGGRDGMPTIPGRRMLTVSKFGPEWPLPKSLTLIPTLYPASLAYGWNMLNPSHTFDRWRVRNIIVWARPNPPVGALGDKVRPATSYITIACTSAKRWFDLDAVRTEHRRDPATISLRHGFDAGTERNHNHGRDEFVSSGNEGGAPPLDWWEDDDPTGHATLVLPTQPYPGAHYATWPEKLAARIIEMMCPVRVCTTCGEPSRRMVGKTDEYAAKGRGWADETTGRGKASGRERNGHSAQPPGDHIQAAEYVTLGWSSCGHGTWRPGRILDPFCGSGTTLAVAQGLGRDATGIELYEANADLTRKRVGMFLEVA